MKSELVSKENISAKFKIFIEADEFEGATEKAYKRTKSRYNIHGFRKGKAPRKIIELNYGKGVFFNDAIDILLADLYPKAIDELELKVVSQPEVDIEAINDDGSVVMVFDVAVKPEIEVSNYKGVEIEKIEKVVTDEEIDSQLNALLERQSRMVTVESPIENGSIAVIDFEGTQDGVAFEGGQASGYSLEVGSGSFIPGFEEQLIGKSTGEEFDINVSFPEDYSAEELAGKPVVFKIKVNEVKVKEVPELDDEFVKDTTEFESVEELKNDTRKNMQTKADEDANIEMKDALVKKIAESVEVTIPEAMIESQLDAKLNEINRQLSSQGWSLEAFAELSGQSIQEIRESRKEEAELDVKLSLVVERISEIENIEITDEEFEAELVKFSNMFGIELEKIRETVDAEGKENIEARMKSEKTIDFLFENASVK